MAYPQKLLHNIYWAFSNGPVAEDIFESTFKTYHEDISGTPFPLEWDAIIFPYPRIALQYVKYTEDDVEEPDVLVEASNGQHFTVGELLYKIHQIGLALENDDNCYFEGLLDVGEPYEYSVGGVMTEVPAYFLLTGS